MAKKTTQESFTEDERAAMKERAAELKAAGKRGTGAKKAEADLQDCLAKIAEMPDADRVIDENLHEIVTTTTPDLLPKTWYVMPAYDLDGKTVVFFKPAAKFKVRYATLGFQPDARIDDGDMWPIAFAVTQLTPAVERRMAELVKKAVS